MPPEGGARSTASGVAAAAGAAATSAGGELSPEMQVHYVLRLLTLKGEATATQLRQRMDDGRGVTAKGLHFAPDVLKEALEKWDKTRSGKVGAPEKELKQPKPVQLAEATPEPTTASPITAVSGSGLALPTARRRPSASGGAAPSQPPRKRSFSTTADENLDPQAFSAIGRASKEKAERRGVVSSDTGQVRCTPPEAPAPDPAPPTTLPQGSQGAGAGSCGGLDAEGPSSYPAASSKPPSKRLRRVPSSQPEAASAPAAGGPSAFSPPTEFPSSGPGKSVKELKLLLSECGLDYGGCVEKADLQALWDRFEFFRGRPLEELRGACAANGGPPSAALEECARYLAAPPKAGGGSGHGPAPSAAAALPHAPAAAPAVDEISPEAALRERDAGREVQRIQALRKERFPTAVAWGFAVLDVTARDVAAVQRGYRNLMRKLHPDKVGRSNEVTRAVELIREAKDLCERGLSRQEPPSAPRCLRASTVCSTHGRRQFRLQWLPPDDRPSAPVRRYIVAAVDPAYGRALTITVLEPDYSEELHRFVGVEELTSYIFAEEELQKMPRLWQQPFASVQVAAANEAGQSQWAMMQLPLTAPAAAAPAALPQPDWASSFRSAAAGPPSSWVPPGNARSDMPDDPATFDREVRRRQGDELRAWLEKQRKPQLAAWLRFNSWPSLGNKEDLIERIEQAVMRKPTFRRGTGKL